MLNVPPLPSSLVPGQEKLGFQEPTIIGQQHSIFGRLPCGDSPGNLAPHRGDALPVMRVAFPDKGIGAEDRRQEIALGISAFEEGIHFQALEGKNDQVIEADRLPDEHPHLHGGEFADGHVAEIITGRKGMKVPGKIPKLLAL